VFFIDTDWYSGVFLLMVIVLMSVEYCYDSHESNLGIHKCHFFTLRGLKTEIDVR